MATKYLTGSEAAQYTSSALNKYSGRADTGYNPNIGVRNINGVIQTGHYGKTTPVASIAAPKAKAPKAPSVEVEKDTVPEFDKDTMTVSGQLDNILKEDSALMKRTRNMSDVITNIGGLGGSSMQGRASMGAMVDKATPIATSDATFYNNDRINQMNISSQEKMNLMSLQASMAQSYMGNITSGGMSSQFSAGEAAALTDFYNDSATNLFTTAQYGGFTFG